MSDTNAAVSAPAPSKINAILNAGITFVKAHATDVAIFVIGVILGAIL